MTQTRRSFLRNSAAVAAAGAAGVELPALAAVGFVSGFLNVLAGGGSLLTLPLLIFLGLPAAVANGTNRIGILCQNLCALGSFRRHGVLRVICKDKRHKQRQG